MYSRRIYPEGCTSFKKLAIKLFRVDKNAQGGPRLRLVDSHYANNKEGFGYMLKNLKQGDYQLQVKKYSSGSDVYDFTTRIWSSKNIKMIDVE